MIEQFLIFRPSGIVDFNYQKGKNLTTIVNGFIEDVVISERKYVAVEGSEHKQDEAELAEEEEKKGLSDENSVYGAYTKDNYSLKYLISTDDTERTFYAMLYPSLINVKSPYELLKSVRVLWENTDDRDKFKQFFDLKVGSVTTQKKTKVEEEPASEPEETPVVTTSKPSKKTKSKKTKAKKSRKWNDDGTFYEDDDQDQKPLDFSTAKGKQAGSANLDQLVGDKSKFGSTTKSGEFLVSDLSQEMDQILADDTRAKGKETATQQQPFGFLRNVIGGKTIEKKDIEKVKTALATHLVEKNVAPDVANSLIAEIEQELVGSKTASFTSVEETAKKSLEKQLIKLLTPNSSVDLLNEIQEKKAKNGDPYVISVVGVNGVGKSTNLSKLAYWLLQNNYRVLITACDTFRSGAVEQLRTHVNNLSKLSPEKQQIELFEGGYGGSDLVAKIATGAIKYAKENKFDIVLLDTAGRRHNDSHLMAPLASFAKAAKPDKLIMVGEALVGTDSVMQAKNFNKAFGATRHLDFFIISKCDTVGDLIGSMVNMVFATGIPILFVGTGQTYTDLRTLSVSWAVDRLMS